MKRHIESHCYICDNPVTEAEYNNDSFWQLCSREECRKQDEHNRATDNVPWAINGEGYF